MTLSFDDVQQIQQLKARYFRFVDTKDWEGFRTLFTDDLIVYRSVLDPKPEDVRYRDADSFVAYVRAALAETVSVHHGHMPELWSIDESTAGGIWAMRDWIEAAGPGRSFVGYGHYHERYRRTGGSWRIAEMALVRLRVDPVPKTVLPYEET